MPGFYTSIFVMKRHDFYHFVYTVTDTRKKRDLSPGARTNNARSENSDANFHDIFRQHLRKKRSSGVGCKYQFIYLYK